MLPETPPNSSFSQQGLQLPLLAVALYLGVVLVPCASHAIIHEQTREAPVELTMFASRPPRGKSMPGSNTKRLRDATQWLQPYTGAMCSMIEHAIVGFQLRPYAYIPTWPPYACWATLTQWCVTLFQRSFHSQAAHPSRERAQ